MKRVILTVCGLVWILLARPVAAQSGDSPVVLAVIDGAGSPQTIAELGCAYSDGPGFPFEQYQEEGCFSCSVYTCTFDTSRPGMGGYASTALLNYTMTVPSGAWQLTQGSKTGVLWGDSPWYETRYITFVLSEPTPIPTLTPIPTATAPAAVGVEGLSSGFGMTFTEVYGTLSDNGMIPDFAVDQAQWLFYGRKWLQFMNQGNLLYVMGGVLMAVLVLKWAIDRVKNPR